MNLELKDYRRKETLNAITDYVYDINSFDDRRCSVSFEINPSGYYLGVHDWTKEDTEGESRYKNCTILSRSYGPDELNHALTDVIKYDKMVRRLNQPTPEEAVRESIERAIETFKEDVEWETNITLAKEEWDTLYSKCMKAWEDVSK